MPTTQANRLPTDVSHTGFYLANPRQPAQQPVNQPAVQPNNANTWGETGQGGIRSFYDPTTGNTTGTFGGYTMPGLNEQSARVWDPFSIFNKKPTEYMQFAGSSKLSKEQQNMLSKMAGYLDTEAGKDQSYGGQLTAGINDIQMSSIGDLMKYQSPTASIDTSTIDALSKIINSGNREALEAQYRESLEKPLTSVYQNVTMPNLMSAFASKGLSFGTDKQTATNSAAATLMDALARGRTDLEANVASNQLAGIGRANEYRAGSLAEILGLTSAKGEAGKTVQDTQQAGLTAQYQNWLRNQPGSNPVMQEIMKLLGIETVYDQQVVVPGQEGGGGIGGLIGSIFG